MEDPQVVAGHAEFHQVSPTHFEITTQNATIIDCKGFNIPENHTVKINQPNSQSRVLTRVRGDNPSQILGRLESVGKIFLINPNGIFFGPNCTVSTGSLIASTLDIADDDFRKGHFRFKLSPKAKGSQITNKGILTAGLEGHIALLASHILNEGTINAHAGKVAFLGAEIVTLDLTGDNLISFALEGELEQGIIEHLGKIACQEGTVYMRLSTAKQALDMIVNRDGLTEGKALIRENGVVRIASTSEILAKNISLEGAEVDISGRIKSSSVEVTGKQIKVNQLIGTSPSMTLTFNGKVHLAGKIKVSKSDISFNGPTFIGAHEAIELSTGIGRGDISFNGPVDGEGPSSSLIINTGDGDVRCGASIGKESPLKALKIKAKSVELHDIGGERRGCDKIEITASDGIHLRGNIYKADEQVWKAQSYHIYNPAQFISHAPLMEFKRGPIELKEGASFHLNTNGGHLDFSSIKAGKRADISLITGPLTLGDISSSNSSLTICAENIVVKGNVRAIPINIQAKGDIVSGPESHKIMSKGNITLISAEGSIGYQENNPSLSSLRVESDKKIYVGSPKIVDLEGFSVDQLLRVIPGNKPTVMIFNDNRIDLGHYNEKGDVDIDEILSSLAPHLFSKKRGDYIDTTIVNPMPPFLYYRP
jgi:filamentous hemagglutinin family protein